MIQQNKFQYNFMTWCKDEDSVGQWLRIWRLLDWAVSRDLLLRHLHSVVLLKCNERMSFFSLSKRRSRKGERIKVGNNTRWWAGRISELNCPVRLTHRTALADKTRLSPPIRSLSEISILSFNSISSLSENRLEQENWPIEWRGWCWYLPVRSEQLDTVR